MRSARSPNEMERLRHIESRIAQIDAEGELSVDDVIMRSEPAQQLLSMRRVVPSFVAGARSIRELSESVRAAENQGRARPADGARACAGVRAGSHRCRSRIRPARRDLVDTPALANGEPLSVRELPAVARMATCVRIGLPERAHLITGKVGVFLEANGYTLAGPSREVFLQPPRLSAWRNRSWRCSSRSPRPEIAPPRCARQPSARKSVQTR